MPQKWSAMTPEQQARKRERSLRWYYDHKAEVEAQRKTPEHRERMREYVRKYAAKNRAKLNEAARESRRARRATDPEWREVEQARSRAAHHKHRERRLAEKREKWADPEHRAAANAKRRAHHAANREDANAKRKENEAMRRQLYPWEKLLRSAELRARAKGLAFALTREWAEERWTGRCEVSGLPFVVKEARSPGPKFFSPSIDQIRPKCGYTPDNCRFVLWAVNALKHDGTDEDMMLVVRCIYEKNPLFSVS